MTIGNTRESIAERKILHEDDVLISESKFNLIVGGTLLWGFLLNWLTIHFFQYSILEFAVNTSPWVIIVGYLVLALAGCFMVASKSSVISFVGYNFIAVPIGVLLSILLMDYDPDIVRDAVMYTGIITLVFMALATWKTDFFLSIGGVLAASLGMLIIGECILGLFFGNWINLDLFAAVLFGLFIGFDWARCATCQPTVNNAIDIAANLYLDIINLFIRILEIIGKNDK